MVEGRHVIKYDHRDGHKLIQPEYWCGEVSKSTDWHFLDAQHVALSVGGSVQPCTRCIKSIISTLEEEL